MILEEVEVYSDITKCIYVVHMKLTSLSEK